MHSHLHTLSHTRSLTHTHVHANSHSHTHTHTHTHTHRPQTWKGDVLTTRKNREKGAEPDASTTVSKELTNQASFQIHSDDESGTTKRRNPPTRKTSMANAFHNLKLLVNPNKKDISEHMSLAGIDDHSRQRKMSAVTPGLSVPQLGKDFRWTHPSQYCGLNKRFRWSIVVYSDEFIVSVASVVQHGYYILLSGICMINLSGPGKSMMFISVSFVCLVTPSSLWPPSLSCTTTVSSN